MRRFLSLIMMIAFGLIGYGQEVEEFAAGMLHTYPEARLLDIYKSCFQDFMGAEHLVGDIASARNYLEQEVASTSSEDLLPWYYEPCGLDGRYVRVSLRAIHDGLITTDELLDAFVNSANATDRPTVEQWSARWHDILEKIDGMKLDLPYFEQDKQFIDSVLAQGKYAISHSPEYREAYKPHYRIVRRDIFEQEFLPRFLGQ